MGKFILKWSKTALNDLEQIISYISADSLDIAIEKYELIKDAVESISRFPNQGRVIPELEKFNIVKFREIVVNPWRIMYKIENKKIIILAVFDGRRNIEDVLLQRLLKNTF